MVWTGAATKANQRWRGTETTAKGGQYKTETADCGLQTGYKTQTGYKMQTADRRLGIKCRLIIKKNHIKVK